MPKETPGSQLGSSYAGDVPADQAWAILTEEKAACLVDVRTNAEWSYVGLADLSGLGKTPLLVEWQRFPAMQVDEDFVGKLVAELASARSTDRGATLLFLCRSGVRSKSAAQAMTAAGFSRCFNVTGGFEGPKDDQQHRGSTDGWKALGLPWTQG